MREQDYWKELVPSGTKLCSVSCDSEAMRYLKRIRKKPVMSDWVYTYDPTCETDVTIYKGPFSMSKMETELPLVYEHSFVTIKDLRIPSKDERIRIFRNVIDNDQIKMEKELKDVQAKLRRRTSFISDEAINIDFTAGAIYQYIELAYELFCYSMQTPQEYAITSVFSDFVQNDFDGMVDDNDAGRYNGASSPLIVFKASKVLKPIRRSFKVSESMIEEKTNALRKKLNEEGFDLIR